MFIQSVFKRVNRWCIYNIFWHFIPVFCYSNTEGVFSDVSVCSIINYKADISGSRMTYREIEEIQESGEEEPLESCTGKPP
jgi:hypothetical protein